LDAGFKNLNIIPMGADKVLLKASSIEEVSFILLILFFHPLKLGIKNVLNLKEVHGFVYMEFLCMLGMQKNLDCVFLIMDEL